MTDILKAIHNISKLENWNIEEVILSSNRAISMGEGLESFVKNAFADTFKIENQNEKHLLFSEIFSYEGSKRTPPDLMIKNSDAFEIKKTEVLSTEIQLNSSHPKSKLFKTSTLINNHCKNCETWEEKNFHYIIGHIPKGKNVLSSIWFIDGSVYAADEEVYTNIKDSISDVLENSNEFDFSETNEIGRINYVDPLKITNLRIRGMWLLQPPYKVFDYLNLYDNKANFQSIALISKKHYFNYSEESRKLIENNPKISIKEVFVKNPNNPIQLIESKLIIFKL